MDTLVLICNPIFPDDARPRIPGSQDSVCGECGCGVWVTPTSQDIVATSIEPVVIRCLDCAFKEEHRHGMVIRPPTIAQWVEMEKFNPKLAATLRKRMGQ